MEIKCLRLITGEDIICELESNVNGYVLKNPVQVSMVPSRSGNQPNFGFLPFPLVSNDKSIAISLSSVMFICDPAEEFLEQYNQIFGSGLVVPKKSLIV